MDQRAHTHVTLVSDNDDDEMKRIANATLKSIWFVYTHLIDLNSCFDLNWYVCTQHTAPWCTLGWTTLVSASFSMRMKIRWSSTRSTGGEASAHSYISKNDAFNHISLIYFYFCFKSHLEYACEGGRRSSVNGNLKIKSVNWSCGVAELCARFMFEMMQHRKLSDYFAVLRKWWSHKKPFIAAGA